MTPFVLSINCGTGIFADNMAIAESLQRATDGGAVGVIAPAGITWSGYNELLLQGAMTSIWPEFDFEYDDDDDEATPVVPHRKMGEVLEVMKLYLQTFRPAGTHTERHLYLYNLFGDPELSFRTNLPIILESADIKVTSSQSARGVRVIRTSGAPEGALVGLSQRDRKGTIKLLGRAFSEDGEAKIVVKQQIDGRLGPVYLTVTHDSMVPYVQILRWRGRLANG